MLDSALALRRKEGDIVREKKIELSILHNLVKIKLKHANGKIKFFPREIKNTNKFFQSFLKFSYAFFF